MKVLVQRVSNASVIIDGACRGAIARGLLLFVGIGREDTKANLISMAEKVTNLRIFPDEQGRFHFSVKEVGGGVLAVPQFTLYGDTSKGRRPEFFAAMPPADAEPMFEQFLKALRDSKVGIVESGVFGAHMAVSLLNDGPVTIMLEN